MDDRESADIWNELEWRESVADDRDGSPLSVVWLWVGLGAFYIGGAIMLWQRFA